MNWLFFALLAPAISSTVNFLDKYIVKGYKIDYKGMPIFATITSFVLGGVVWGKEGFPTPHTESAALVILAGILSFTAATLYFRVVNSVAVSKIIILFQLTPIFVLGLSSLFLKEHLTVYQQLGFALIILAAVGLTGRNNRGHDSTGVPLSYFFLIIVVDLLYAASNILVKYGTGNNPVSHVYIYQSLGMGIGALVLFSSSSAVRRGFLHTFRYLNKGPLILLFVNEGVFNVSKLLSVEATSLHSVALVNVVGSTQIFFGILYGWVLNKVSPLIFEENSARQGLVREVIFATIMFIGVYFLY